MQSMTGQEKPQSILVWLDQARGNQSALLDRLQKLDAAISGDKPQPDCDAKTGGTLSLEDYARELASSTKEALLIAEECIRRLSGG